MRFGFRLKLNIERNNFIITKLYLSDIYFTSKLYLSFFLSLGFILKIFLKFRKFQPRYSYKIYSYRKKKCTVYTAVFSAFPPRPHCDDRKRWCTVMTYRITSAFSIFSKPPFRLSTLIKKSPLSNISNWKAMTVFDYCSVE